MAASSLSCPHCGQLDSVRKVSAIVSSGTSSGSYTGYGDGIGYSSSGMIIMDELITLTGSSQTQLSSLLSPPRETPDRTFESKLARPGSICLMLLGAFGMLAFFISLANLTSESGAGDTMVFSLLS